ncbi:hypothetical protein EC957_003468 [Mortierella hygrophila]|uniref:DNA-directed primase/polymerase protein n=1 Tax=Mortierella hygrophila TaxID=979708 RepID=A0A9P6FFC1_9FUNG|nr:hypothetical protein EC957_003468 [Mortierella hygrophila]
MEHKFESTYFKSDKKKQTQGPQARSYEWGDKNSHLFFVAIDTGPTYYQYSNYKDPARFLEAYASVPDADRCFFEQIHEGHACNEYYDIDLTLGQVADKSDILRLEQQMFIAFLNARNQYAPDYPLDTTHCRVLSASKNKKISLHIVIPTYVFENNNRHMKAFVLAFKDAWSSASDEDSALLKRIDTKVYTRNRVMRILGSCKFKDRNRPLQRAQWHEPSMNAEDQEFLITNIAAPHTRVRPIAKGSEEGKPVITNRERAHSLMIRSATGTGKTEFVKALVKANKGFNFVAVACRRTLANALGPRLGFTNYQDIKESRIACDRLVIQAESLHRINTRYYGENVILILDEFSSLCEQMTSTSTMGHNHDYNNQILCEFIKGVSRVICLDADLTNRDVQLVKSLRNDVHVIHNTFKPQEGDRVVIKS